MVHPKVQNKRARMDQIFFEQLRENQKNPKIMHYLSIRGSAEGIEHICIFP